MTTRLIEADIPEAVLEVVKGLQQAGHRAFLVGGCVRDLLRGQKPKDFDVATSARPAVVQKLFRRVIPTGIEHGTVTVVVRGAHVEVTTFRAEADYVDGRRPSRVDFHDDIDADLARRDFTMNAMAWDPVSRLLVDPFGGQDDLKARVVRCVRDPMERFSEDGLRPLRAVRFATVLDFTVDPSTEAAIPPTLPVFRKVAPERVHQEFVKLLVAPHAPFGLTLLSRTGLLGVFLPEAEGSDFAAVGRAPAEEAPRLAVLLGHRVDARDLVLRLRFPTRVAEEVGHLVKHQELPPEETDDAGLRRWLSRVDERHALTLLEVAAARGREPAGLRARVEALLRTRPPLTTKALALDGKALMDELGVGPSPLVGQASRYLLDVVLDDPTRNTPDGLRAALKAWKRPSS
ncbi:MAG: [cytidine(C)-cytidine(C)-adenosine (A)]-adding enzyme [Myxococcota bacterium]